MPIKKPDEKVLQIVVKLDKHTKLRIKSALAGMSMTEFMNSAIENYTPEKKDKMAIDFKAKQGVVPFGNTSLDAFQLSNGEYSVWTGHLSEFLQLHENGQDSKLMEDLIEDSSNGVTYVVLENTDTPLQTISLKLLRGIIIDYATEGNKWCQALIKVLISEALTIRALDK